MAFTEEQRRNAAIIADVGRKLGASDRDILIALMTASQESNLRNLNYGDRDSVGLFQQRAAWAPLAKRMDPYESAKMFFTGGEQGQRGLFDFKTRDRMSLTQAAQAVQVSAFPDAYAKWEDDARSLMADLGGGTGLPPTGAAVGASVGAGAPTSSTMQPIMAPAAQTASALGAELGAGVQQAPAGGAIGIGEVSAPGAGEIVEPLEPPDDTSPLDYETFSTLFPDASQLGTFTAPVYGSPLYGAPTYSPAMDGRRQAIVSAAYQWIGTPYQWGGTSRGGADCSGFIQSLFKNFGIELPRISADQARSGVVVSAADARPGDLVAWDNSARNNGADHIALYVGNGQIIELPRAGLNGRLRKLDPDEGSSFVRLNGF